MIAASAGDRIVALDLIRGVAVLGILTMNIAGFAGPTGATLSPHVPAPGSWADEAIFAGGLVLFEGKMRALFTMLFGASMLLFIDRAEAGGREGDVLQPRRLGWLALFGGLHFFLLWWGDILFAFAAIGVIALFMRELPVRILAISAAVIFAGWSLGGAVMSLPDVHAEERVRSERASPPEVVRHAAIRGDIARRAEREMAEYRLGFVDQVSAKLANRPFLPLKMAWSNVGETLPLMVIGMALYRSGFFSGGWPRRRIRLLAAVGTASGLAATAGIAAWLWQRGFPPQAMTAALLHWLALAHLVTAAGYAALLVLAAPRLAATAIGRRIAAAGRMAFSNYIATTLMMTALFYGWGLGLIGQIDRTGQLGIVLIAWAVMLGWSLPWLARFRQGPLEWLWRSLTERRFVAFMR